MNQELKCSGCEKIHQSSSTLKCCSYCRKVYYCNNICQGIDWEKHKKICKKISIWNRYDEITKYFFGEYEWNISNNIHAQYSYHLLLEPSHIPRFKFTKKTRVENVQNMFEYKGIWYPVYQGAIKDIKITSFVDIFQENSKFNIVLKTEEFKREIIKESSTIEFQIKFDFVKTSPKHSYFITTKPFKAFNDYRVVLTGFPNELQKISLKNILNEKITYESMYKLLEYCLDFYHSTHEASDVFYSKKYYINELVMKLIEENRHEEILEIYVSMMNSWLEVAISMEDNKKEYQKIIQELKEKIKEMIGKCKINEEMEKIIKMRNFYEDLYNP